MGKLAEAGGADWIAKSAQRGGGAASLLAAAVSSDGKCCSYVFGYSVI